MLTGKCVTRGFVRDGSGGAVSWGGWYGLIDSEKVRTAHKRENTRTDGVYTLDHAWFDSANKNQPTLCVLHANIYSVSVKHHHHYYCIPSIKQPSCFLLN